MVWNKDLIKMLMINRKSFIFSSIIIFISIISLFLLIIFQNGIDNLIEIEINNKYKNRDLVALLKDDIKTEDYITELKNEKDISMIYKSYSSLNINNDEYGFLSLNGVPLDFFENVKIEEKYMNNNYLIIPSNLIKENQEILGRTIKLIYQNKELEFIIAGIYYLGEDEMTNAIYTSTDIYETIIEENNFFESTNEIHIVVKNRKDLDNIVKKVGENCEQVYLKDSTGKAEINLYASLSKLTKYFTIGISVFLLISFFITLNAMINQEEESIAILKSLGYGTEKIYLMILYILLFLILSLYILASILCTLILSLIRIMFKYRILNYINLNLSELAVIIIIIFLLLVIVIIINYFKIKKISIIKMMVESE